jgi:hypothetical protein
MIDYLLSLLFPPRPEKLGRIVGVDTVVLLHAIQQGQVTVYETAMEDEAEGVGAVWEWPYGREYPPRRVRRGEIKANGPGRA